MTSTLDAFPPPTTDPVTAPAAAPDTDPPRSDGGRRRRSGWHVLAIVVGAVALLPSLGLVAGGTTLAVAQAANDDGYFTFTPDRLRSDGVAIVSDAGWWDDPEDGPWALDWLDLDVRLRADAVGDTDVFVGVARAEDVDDYLDGAAHDVVDDVEGRVIRSRVVVGSRQVTAPGDLDIWVASANGPGEQELEWAARGGRWMLVVMHADGSADVAADVEVGLRSDAVTPVAVTLIVVGGIGLLSAIALIVVGVRGRRRG